VLVVRSDLGKQAAVSAHISGFTLTDWQE
jgi:hypothetical protein